MTTARILLLSLALATAAASSATAGPYLVRDVLATETSASSRPGRFTVVGERVFFEAADADGRWSLWTSDGTTGNTELAMPLFDDCQHALGCLWEAWEVGGRFVFAYRDELWVSDGTEDGTSPLGSEFRVEGYYVPVSDGRWLFWARDDAWGDGLWITDFTAAGTVPFVDLAPGQEDAFLSYFTGFAGERAVYSVWVGARQELWVTDGTEDGTRRLLDSFISVTVAEDRLFITVQSSDGGRVLWISDGTVGGTRLASATVPGPAGLASYPFPLGDDVLLLRIVPGGGTELWRSDGTEAGTRLLREFGAYTGSGVLWGRVAGSEERAYFLADDGVHGHEIWSTDGTAEGTLLAGDLCPGACGLSTRPQLFPVGQRWFFFARSDAGSGLFELAGDDLSLVANSEDLCPLERCWGYRGQIVDVGGRAVFTAVLADWRVYVLDAGGGVVELGSGGSEEPYVISQATPGGRSFFARMTGEDIEPWVTDGTPENTRQLADLAGGVADSSAPRELARLGDRIVFLARGSDGRFDLWSSRGTHASTRRLAELGLDETTDVVTQTVGKRLIFTAAQSGHDMYWATDGTADGTVTLPVVGEPPHSETPLQRHRTLGTELLWIAGNRVWSSDGTVEGTRVRSQEVEGASELEVLGEDLFFLDQYGSLWKVPAGDDIAERLFGGEVSSTLAWEGKLYFLSGRSPQLGAPGLWSSDGTVAGSELLVELPLLVVGAGPVAVADGLLWVIVPERPGEEAVVRSLWRTDGSAAGTERLLEDIGILRPVESTEDFFFLQTGQGVGTTLWRSDGSAAAPEMIHRWDGPVAAFPWLGDRIYLEHRGELWSTDGTADGTVFLAEIAAHFRYRNGEARLLRIGDRRVFLHPGRSELWITDGTPDGTHPVVDLAREIPTSSFVAWLATAGELLYFSAAGPDGDRELWALPIWDLFADEAKALYLGERARFRVEVEWHDGRRDGAGSVAPLRSSDSGLFWFFSANNWEMLVKVLDGCGDNERFWVFAAATTTVGFDLVVTDTWSGAVRRYENPIGQPARPIVDTEAFAGCDLEVDGARSIAPDSSRGDDKTLGADGVGLCLGDGGRYRVTLAWDDGTSQGTATPVAGSDDSGLFYFFSANNWEMLVKVLDGCAHGGHRWVFAAATTTVGYELRVEDTATGAVRTYRNALGDVAETVTDTAAFVCE